MSNTKESIHNMCPCAEADDHREPEPELGAGPGRGVVPAVQVLPGVTRPRGEWCQ